MNRLRVHTAHLSFPMPGEVKNGDAVVIRNGDSETEVVLAVIDGLGHGPEAAHASQAAREVLTQLPPGVGVEEALREVHRHLRGSRGAAATVCIVRGMQLEACAVGNVALLSVNCSVPLVLSAGVLGHQVAKYRVATAQLNPGARLALLSDGISTRFRLDDLKQLDPARACQEIMDRYRRRDDDASVLMADVSNSQ